jgi:hypothetical protein
MFFTRVTGCWWFTGRRAHGGQRFGAERGKPDTRHTCLLEEGTAVEPARGQAGIRGREALLARPCFGTLDQHVGSLPQPS